MSTLSASSVRRYITNGTINYISSEFASDSSMNGYENDAFSHEHQMDEQYPGNDPVVPTVHRSCKNFMKQRKNDMRLYENIEWNVGEHNRQANVDNSMRPAAKAHLSIGNQKSKRSKRAAYTKDSQDKYPLNNHEHKHDMINCSSDPERQSAQDAQPVLDSCTLASSCPDLFQADEWLLYGDYFEYDSNPTLSKALSNSIEGIRSQELKDLDEQIANDLKKKKGKHIDFDSRKRLEETFRENDDSYIYDKLIEEQVANLGRKPNPGTGVKSIKEEIDENEYFKQFINGSSEDLNLNRRSFDYVLPRTTYIEEDLDETDMQIIVNCFEEHTSPYSYTTKSLKRDDKFCETSRNVCCSLM